MRAVVQRVSRASVSVSNESIAQIGRGLLVLLGIEDGDSDDDVSWMAGKIINLRVFSDKQGKMNLSCVDAGAQVLCVSQFTLCASLKKGARPSFVAAMEPSSANIFFERVVSVIREHLKVETGAFGAHMLVSSDNDGPVTLILDSKNAR